MANAKNKIIEQAKTLFNVKGYRNVSLREIAVAAGTTIGNLTYHFPQKENLILEMQKDLYKDFLSGYTDNTEVQNGTVLFEIILKSFTNIKENRDNYAFFYQNIVELSQESNIIAHNIEEFRLKVFHFYLSSFLKLKDDKIMRPDITENQYEVLAYIIVHTLYLWTQNTTSYYDKNLPRIEISDALINLIYPYFTEHGIDLYNT